MGLGKFLIQSITNTVKCDICGVILVDGRYRPNIGTTSDYSYGGAGLGFFENLANSGRNICSECARVEHFQDNKPAKQQLGALKEIVDKTKKEIDLETKELTELAKQELELKKYELELKRQELEVMKNTIANPNANSYSVPQTSAPSAVGQASAPVQPARKVAFCTNCGSALKPNARFCSNCGNKIA